MSNIDKFSIITLILFFLSTLFVIHPVSGHVPIPYVGKPKLTLGLMTAPILAIAILWAAQCLGPTQIRDGIVGTDGIKPYNILILFISLAYMAITLDVTGILQAAAYWVSNKGGGSGRRLYLYFYILLTLISVVLGNDPIILSGTAFLVYYTKATGLEPVAWLISEFAAANTASMVLFVGNPTNVVICEGFRVNNAAFTAYTILPFIACSLACYGALAFQFRDPKHVPRKLDVKGKLNVWDVLRDHVSAIFGSILLGICLIMVVVLSFLHVDVWKIVLPFAGFKFIFDLCWDHHRYTTNQIPHFDNLRKHTVASIDDAAVEEMKRALTLSPDKLERGVTSTTFTSGVLQPHTGSVLPNSHVRSSSPECIPHFDNSKKHTVAPLDVKEMKRTLSSTPDELERGARSKTFSSDGSQLHTEPGSLDSSLARSSSPECIPPSDKLERGVTSITFTSDGSPVRTRSGPQNSTHLRSSSPEGMDTSPPPSKAETLCTAQRTKLDLIHQSLAAHFPTFFTALPRLPFGLIPFAFSQFILIEGLAHHGWIDVFATWLIKATKGQMIPTIWVVGVLGVLLCNVAGTNIGATILITKVVRAANFSSTSTRAAAIALAVASNIGAVSFTFSASLAGLLWKSILKQKDIPMKQRSFAFWNLLPLFAMTTVGLAVVSAEMVVIHP